MDIYPEVGSTIDGKYKVKDILGSGGTAVVFLCEDIRNNRTHAIKRFFPDKMTPQLKSRIFEEPKLKVRSFYLAKAIKAFKSDGLFHLLLPYLPGEDLSDILDSGTVLDEITATYFITCLAYGLQDLNTAHPTISITDIKPENSRVMPSGKLVVFDLSCFEYIGKRPQISQGTVPYAPPELFNQDKLFLSSDIYSIGMVFYELLIGRYRFNKASEQWQMDLIRGYKADVSSIKSDYPRAFQIIDRAIEPNPSNRYPNADALLSELMPYYQSLIGHKPPTEKSQEVVLLCATGKKIVLPKGVIEIGRQIIAPGNHFISERHCLFNTDKKSQIFIRDISTYGTKLNGRELKKNKWVKVKDTDVIHLANFPIQIRIA